MSTVILKGNFYVGASLCRLCVSNIFGARAGFGMDASHIFPLSVLAVIPLIGAVVGVSVSRACAGYEVVLSLCSWLSLPCWGQGPFPRWNRSLEGWVSSGSVTLECVACPKVCNC